MKNDIDKLLVALNFFKNNPSKKYFEEQDLNKEDFFVLADLEIIDFPEYEYYTIDDFQDFTLDDYERVLKQIEASKIVRTTPKEEVLESYERFEKDKTEQNRETFRQELEKQKQVLRERSEILNNLIVGDDGNVKVNEKDEEEARRLIRENEEALERALAKRVQQIDRIPEKQAKVIATRTIENLGQRQTTTTINEIKTQLGINRNQILSRDEERIIQNAVDGAKNGKVDLQKLQRELGGETTRQPAAEVERQIREAVSAPGEKLTPEAETRVREVAREYANSGKKIDKEAAVAEVRLENPNVKPEKPVENITLSEAEAEIIVANAKNAARNPTAYTNSVIKDIEKVLNTDPAVSKVLDVRKVHNEAVTLAPQITETFLKVDKQIKDLPDSEQITRVSVLKPVTHPLSVLAPFSNPDSPAMNGLNEEQKKSFTENVRIIETYIAPHTDLERRYLLETIGLGPTNGLFGNPNVPYVVSEDEKDEDRQRLNVNEVYDWANRLHELFGREVAVTGEELGIVPIETFGWYNPAFVTISADTSIVPLANAALATYPEWETTSALLGYFSEYSLGVPTLGSGFTGFALPATTASDTFIATQIIDPIAGTFAGPMAEVISTGTTTALTATGAEAIAVGGTELAVAGTGAAVTAAAETGVAAGTGIAATGLLGGIAAALGPVGIAIGTFLAAKALPIIKRNLDKILSVGGLLAIAAGVIDANPILLVTGIVGLAGAAFVAEGGITGALAVGAGTIAAGVSAITAATVAAMIGPLIAALIGIPVVVALILFIINSGAYVVPAGTAFTGAGQGNLAGEACFTFQGDWQSHPKNYQNAADSVHFLVSNVPSYVNALCANGQPIVLKTGSLGGGEWGQHTGAREVTFDLRVGGAFEDFKSGVYILAHELGHVYDRVVPGADAKFYDTPGISTYSGLICTYPIVSNNSPTETFAEEIADYISYSPISPGRPLIKTANCMDPQTFEQKYPNHFQFVHTNIITEQLGWPGQ